jgi:hypothetical protein
MIKRGNPTVLFNLIFLNQRVNFRDAFLIVIEFSNFELMRSLKFNIDEQSLVYKLDELLQSRNMLPLTHIVGPQLVVGFIEDIESIFEFEMMIEFSIISTVKNHWDTIFSQPYLN